MTMQIVYSEIIDGQLILPPQALAILPSNTKLFMVIDSERGILTVRANDPTVAKNEEFLDALAELNEGLSLDEYTAPVPENAWRKHKSDNKEGE
ncbi:hypothetical protein V8J88_03085 [Massilia sp. W12]|uniref:hypothetical protein n=1 Tax=Massilia sp. W12 TaxID=3126507 RepID=UPI0030D57C9D